MKTIILIRHGESETNLTKQFTGQLDIPLTKLGKQQAERMAVYLDNYKIDKIYASSLSRAYETAMAIVRRQNCPIEKSESFWEINAGCWHGLTFDEIISRYPDTYKVWKENLAEAHPDGGESTQALYDRVTSKFKQIIDKTDDQVICIVAHATPIRMIESYIMGNDLKFAQEISWVPNASTSVYQYDGDFTTICRGYCDYLGDMLTNLPKTI